MLAATTKFLTMVQIMELLGPSLWDVLHESEKKMPVQFVACVAVEVLRILQDLHGRGCAPTQT